jgi:DNA-binding LacI/PurR family transcriptional regulator
VATIKDIARYTGLALSTISKYLNGGSVRENTRIKIEEALSVLDYKRNEAARSLKTNKSMTVGILIPNLRSHFDTTIIAMVEEELTRAGYSVIICGYHQSLALEREKLRFLIQKRIDGLITIPSGANHREIGDFMEEGRSLVFIDRPVPGIEADTILVDNEPSCYLITKYLIEKGHRSIGIICGSSETYTSRERLNGYLRADKETGNPVDVNLVCYGDWSRQSGYDFTRDLLSRPEPMSALISCSDDTSIGALQAVSQLSVSIPETLSMISYDLLEFADVFRPAITTIEQPVSEIGRMAAELLLKRMGGADGEPRRTIVMKTSFVERGSVGTFS